MHIQKIITRSMILATFLVGLGFCTAVLAAEPVTSLYEANGTVIRKLPTIPKGAHVAVGDLGQDGIAEIVVGSPAGAKPSIRILRLDGTQIRTISIGSVKGTPGVRVALGDIDGDGEPEIVSSFGKGTTPEIRIYTAAGERQHTFLAFGKGFRGGVNITVGDVDANGVADIIAGAGSGGGPYVVTFAGSGQKLMQFQAYPASVRSGVQVYAADANGDGVTDIVTGTKAKNSTVKVFGADGRVTSSFMAKQVQPASVHVASANTGTILLGSTAGSAGQITSYTSNGQAADIHFYPYGKKFTGEVMAVAVNADSDAGDEVLVVPNFETTVSGAKRIVVDISDQKMYRYVGSTLVATHRVSTGTWSMPTPLGAHQIHNKLGTAYSRKYALYMDNWMAITADGAYGIHSLPYWRLKNGGIYYEGVSHLGRRVSHGCIRLSPAESTQVFAWTSVGTKVNIVE